jgi:hypothetical protein
MLMPLVNEEKNIIFVNIEYLLKIFNFLRNKRIKYIFHFFKSLFFGDKIVETQNNGHVKKNIPKYGLFTEPTSKKKNNHDKKKEIKKSSFFGIKNKSGIKAKEGSEKIKNKKKEFFYNNVRTPSREEETERSLNHAEIKINLGFLKLSDYYKKKINYTKKIIFYLLKNFCFQKKKNYILCNIA